MRGRPSGMCERAQSSSRLWHCSRLQQLVNPDEIVRLYDGGGNPLGKAFTTEQFEAMFAAAGMTVSARRRYYFPLRAFGPVAPLMRPFQ
jgi:hypothetical protein